MTATSAFWTLVVLALAGWAASDSKAKSRHAMRKWQEERVRAAIKAYIERRAK